MKIVVIALEAELPQELPDGYYKIVTGVGKLNAAIELCTRIAVMPNSITEVINYGTAGIVSKKPLIGQLVQPDVIIQRDMLAEPQAPRGVVPFEQGDTAGPILLNTDTNITLGTGDSFVMDTDPWFDYASIDLVDMEAYALAKVARRYNIPFKCYKYVSDFADENAADTWQENVDKGADYFLKTFI
jgi:adenosylhomocysteine nucleosidase